MGNLVAHKAARVANWNERIRALSDEARDIYFSATAEHFELADVKQQEIAALNPANGKLPTTGCCAIWVKLA